MSAQILSVPNIDSYMGLMHTLFAVETLYGLKVGEIEGEVCPRLDKSKGTTHLSMLDMLITWKYVEQRLKRDEISKEKYDAWRYN